MTTNEKLSSMEEALHDLALLSRSGDRVWIGYEITGCATDKSQPMSASDAEIFVRAMEMTSENVGRGPVRFSVWRVEA